MAASSRFPPRASTGSARARSTREALARVFSVKGRPDSKPLLVLVDSVEMAERLAADVPPGARDLMARHWPGRSPSVLKAAPRRADRLTAGTGTIGVRMPGHPVALGLVRGGAACR